MEWLNHVSKRKIVSRQEYEVMMLLLATFAPHMTEELWQGVLGHIDSVHSQTWPVFEESYLVEESVSLAVQVNGKVRGVINLSSDESTDDEAVKMLAQQSPNVTGYLSGKEIRKVIYVPGKIVNFVVS
jgi:leucyl-tRNA synthetase